MAGYYIPLVGTPQIGDSGGGGGGGGSVLVVNVASVEGARTCDKTAGEIYDACPNVVFQSAGENGYTVEILQSYYAVTEGQYAGYHGFNTLSYNGLSWSMNEYTAASSDDYPIISGD